MIALLTGGVLSWYASPDPDGLEWSISKITGSAELAAVSPIQKALDTWRERISLFPDYAPRTTSVQPDEPTGGTPPTLPGVDGQPATTRLDSGTSLAGVIGGLMVLVLVALIALLAGFLKKRQRSQVQHAHRPEP
jgi:cobalt/nickel transport system permease protein